ncbi:MAG: hypothetical protein AB7F43_00765 [Bacteriovoracia bacterium]
MRFKRKVRQYWSLGVLTLALAIGFPLIGSYGPREVPANAQDQFRGPAQSAQDFVQLNQVITGTLTSPLPAEINSKVVNDLNVRSSQKYIPK